MKMENKDLVVVDSQNEVSAQNDSFDILGNETILMLADQAEKRIEAMNKIMNASLKMTTVNDWVLIGGIPYLQESGATKVARLFGISWQIEEPKKETRADGHYTFTYKGKFSLAGATIEAEGARSSFDDFFASAGKDKPRKSPDEIDMRDVKLSAYTNCINNGIKRILPGLRNLTVEDLAKGGIDTSKLKGYSFKGESKKATSKVEGSGFICEHCGAEISSAEASYSKSYYGKELCRKCQKLAKEGGLDDSRETESTDSGNKAE